jgi:SPP1 family predicted phage head-tail adaptor
MIGRMRHQITFTLPTKENPFGEVTEPTVTTRWAEVRALSGRELMNAAQTMNAYTYQVHMRYTEGINEKMRIVYRGKTLEIVSIIEDERQRWMTLNCVETT